MSRGPKKALPWVNMALLSIETMDVRGRFEGKVCVCGGGGGAGGVGGGGVSDMPETQVQLSSLCLPELFGRAVVYPHPRP